MVPVASAAVRSSLSVFAAAWLAVVVLAIAVSVVVVARRERRRACAEFAANGMHDGMQMQREEIITMMMMIFASDSCACILPVSVDRRLYLLTEEV